MSTTTPKDYVGTNPTAHLVDERYSLDDLIDLDRLRVVLEDFAQATGFTASLATYPDQELLVATGWRDACTRFHRAVPTSAAHCQRSDILLTSDLRDHKECNFRACGMGLIEGAAPVYIKGQHVASLFTGQVFFDKPDMDNFRKQATEYGYDPGDYLAAISEVPVITELQFKKTLSALAGIASMAGEQGLANLKLKESAKSLQDEIDERLTVQQALSESERRFSSVLQSSPMGTFLYRLEPDGRLIFEGANPAASNTLGIDCERFVGLTIEEAFPPLADTEIPERYRLAAADGTAWQSEQLDYSDDSVSGAYQVYAYQTSPNRMAATFLDITDRKRAELELQRYEHIVSSSNDMLALLDKNFVFLAANDKYLKAFSKTRNEIIGFSAAEVFGEAFFDSVIRPNAEKCLKGDEVRYQDWFDFPTIGRRYMEITYDPYWGPDNDIAGFVVNGRDSTKRRLAEDAQRESEERFRSIIEKTDAGYFFIDRDGIIREANEAWVRMYKYSTPDEVIGKHFAVIQKADDVEQAKEFVEGIMAGDTRYLTGEFSRKCKDDSIGYHTFSARPVSRSGQVIGIEGFIIDTTERKGAEHALKQLVEATSSQFGRAFFDSMALQLSETLGADYAFIGELAEGRADRIKTVSVVAAGELADNFTYDLAGTPCENVIGRTACTYLSGVAVEFPEDVLLEQMGVEGYIGVPLFDSHKNALGIVVALYRKPIEKPEFKHAILQIFSSRIGSELERSKSNKALADSEEKFRSLYDSMNEGVCLHELVYDEDGKAIDYRLTDVNPAYERVLNLRRADAVGQLGSKFYGTEEAPYLERWVPVAEGGDPDVFETYFPPMDKHFSISCFSPGHGKFATVFTDITQRKISENLSQIQRDLAHDLNAVTTVEAALGLCLETALKASGMDSGGFYLVDQESGDVNLVFHHGLSAKFASEGAYYPADSEHAQLVAAGQPKYCVAEQLGELMSGSQLDEVVTAMAVLPVTHDGAVIGCINVASHSLKEISTSARNALEAIAAEVGGTISRLRGRDALSRSEHKLLEAQKIAKLGHYALDLKADSWTSSTELDAILGIDENYEKNVVGWLRIVHPDHRKAMSDSLQHVVSSRLQEFDQEYMIVDASSGEEKWVRELGSLRLDEDGAPVEMFGTIQDITDRKRAEEALRESEEDYRSLVANIPDVVWTTDENAHTTFISANVEEIYGYTPAEIRREGERLWLNRIHPEDIDRVTDAFAGLVKHGTPYNIEYRIRRKDERWIWLHDRALRTRGGHGEIRVDGVFSDITDRKQAEEALLSEKGFTETALNSQQDTFFLFDPETGRAIRWNQAFNEITGYSDEEITEMAAPSSYYSPEDLERASISIQEVLSTGIGTIEMELVCKNGRKVPFEYNVSVVKDEKDLPKYIISVGRNITERKRAEEEMREKAHIIDSASSAIATSDLQGMMTNFNPAFKGMWGADNPDDVLGKHFTDLWLLEDRYAEIMTALRVEGKWAGEAKARKSDGTVFDVQVSAAMVRDKDGNPVSLMSSSVDITERNRVQERFRLAAQVATDLIYEWDIENDNLAWFGDIDKALGYRPGELTHTIEAWVAIIHPDDVAKLADAVELHRTSTNPIQYEYRVRHNDGSWRYWLDHGTPILNDQGLPCKWIGTCTDITERKRAEEELQKLAAIVKHSGELINLSTPEGKMVFLNEAGGRMLGLDPQELEDANIMDVIPDRWVGLVENELVPALMKGETWEGDLQYRNLRTGDLTDVHAMTFVVPNPDTNEPQFFANVSMDITARKRAEVNLGLRSRIANLLLTATDESMYSEVLDVVLETTSSEHGVFGYIDENGDLVCPSMTKSIWSQCEMTDKTVVFPRETWSGIWGRALMEAKTHVSNELFSVPDGHIPVQRAMDVPIVQSGVVIGNLLVGNKATDYTDDDRNLLESIAEQLAPVLNARLRREGEERERKQAELELSESEARYRTLVENAPEAIVVMDINTGTFVDANENAEKLYGLARDRLLDCNPADVSPEYQPDGRSSQEAAFDYVQRAYEGDPQVFEWAHLNASTGEGHLCEIRLVRLPSSTEKLIRGSVIDITDRKRAEAELVEFSEKLQEANSQLQARQQELEEFTYTVSHDLKAPVVSISGFVSLLSEKIGTRIDSTERRYLERIESNARTMEDLLRDLLELSRIGRIDEEVSRIDMNVMVDDVIAGLAIAAAPQGVELSRFGELPSCTARPRRIRQVVTNLLDNAIKYMPEETAGQVEVGYDPEKKDLSGTTGAYFVRDNGRGIAVELHDRVFKLFQRGPGSQSVAAGTGVGLTASRRIVETHEGHLWFESDIGQGSTFYFSLPRTGTQGDEGGPAAE